MPGDYWAPTSTETIALGLEHATEIHGAVKDLGTWLDTAPEHIRAHFAAHAFPDPTLPGAHIEDFLAALGDAWGHLHDALGHTTAS